MLNCTKNANIASQLILTLPTISKESLSALLARLTF